MEIGQHGRMSWIEGLSRGRIEAAWFGPPPTAAPTLVLLHEGLGCVAMWRDFPARLVQATGWGALVYSRYGYGGSAPCPRPRPPQYMHDEALEILPELLAAAGIREHVLVGHSDGGSIALIHAGGAPRAGLRGLVVLAPHVFIEDISVASIAKAGEDFRTTDLAERLRRYHGDNLDSAFWGWQRAWVSAEFRHWNIEEYLPRIRVPVLAMQGADDQYGTMQQIGAIVAQAGDTVEAVKLAACGHSPYREQPDATLARITQFIGALPDPR
jgi:pimeloyl-ACP methyl ester carboxylesterase